MGNLLGFHLKGLPPPMSTFVLMVISIVVTLVVSILSIIVSTSAGVDWSLKLLDDLKNRVDQRRVRP